MSAVANLEQLISAAKLDPDRVFSAPWEARAFAIAAGLCEKGLFSWDEFREHLIAEVGAADQVRSRAHNQDYGEPAYYEHFLRALEKLLAKKRIVTTQVAS
ncbi:MAG TPA: nitrile hydratase accessory protein [Candidatus Binataceae bacterium]